MCALERRCHQCDSQATCGLCDGAAVVIHSQDVVPCHVGRIVCCRVMSRHVMSHRVVSRHVISWHVAMLCRVMSCHVAKGGHKALTQLPHSHRTQTHAAHAHTAHVHTTRVRAAYAHTTHTDAPVCPPTSSSYSKLQMWGYPVLLF